MLNTGQSRTLSKDLGSVNQRAVSSKVPYISVAGLNHTLHEISKEFFKFGI